MLAILLLRANVAYDPVYAGRPRIKSPLRPALLDVAPGTAAKKSKAKKKKQPSNPPPSPDTKA